MYDIYIKNYLDSDGTPQTNETLLYSIPIPDSDSGSGYVVIDPVIKNEMGKTGTLEFGMAPNHPYYNRLMQMKTIMRVDYDGTCIFRGRVLTIDTSPLTGERKVHLEGDLAFLMDSIQEGTKEVNRSEVTVLSYLQRIIAEHNRQMQESEGGDKNFSLGEVPGQYSSAINDMQKVVVNENKKFGSNGWETTMSALESLEKEYGGYFRTRYANGVCYLDWLEYCFQYTVSSQPIEIGENLIDISGSTEVENIFTALIPIGKGAMYKNNGNKDKNGNIYIDGYMENVHGANKRILVPQIVGLFSDSELNKGYHAKTDYENAVSNYGIIYKTQDFPNADTKEKLWNYAIDWIRENYLGGISSFNLTALDMHHINGAVSKYLCGDRVPVVYPDMSRHSGTNTPTISKIMTLTSIQYNLHNPEKNQYAAGIPNSILNKTYGVSKSTETKSSSSSGSGMIAGGYKGGSRTNFEEEIRRQNLEQEAANHIVSSTFNSADWKAIEEKDPNRAASIIKSSEIQLFHHLDTIESECVLKDQDGNDVTIPKGVKANLTSLVLDGEKGLFKLFDPVVKVMDGIDLPNGTVVDYDAYYDREVGASLIFDGYNRSLELRDIPNWRQTADSFLGVVTKPMEWITGSTFKISHLDSSAPDKGGSAKIETGTPLLDEAGNAISTFITSTTNGQTGAHAAIKSLIGLDGTGDKSTIVQDGETSLVNLFNPSTVGIPGVTPERTLEEDGANGALAAGAGGDLGGWKITLNKPMTYKATIDGKQKTFTVNPGQVAADDMHFTKKYDSVYAELAVFDQMYADYAQIGTLVALKAQVDDLTAKSITTDSLEAAIANIPSLRVQAMVASLEIQAASGRFGRLYLSGDYFRDTLINRAEVSADGKTLILTQLNGDEVRFSK